MKKFIKEPLLMPFREAQGGMNIMIGKKEYQPLQHIKYPAEYVGLDNMVFDESSIVIRGEGRKRLPLEATISGIRVTPGTFFHMTKRNIFSYPVSVVEGNVDNGKFKGVIHARRVDLPQDTMKFSQLHFYLGKDGRFYKGKSMDYDHIKKRLTADLCELGLPLDISGIGTQYEVDLPFRKVLTAYFQPK